MTVFTIYRTGEGSLIECTIIRAHTRGLGSHSKGKDATRGIDTHTGA